MNMYKNFEILSYLSEAYWIQNSSLVKPENTSIHSFRCQKWWAQKKCFLKELSSTANGCIFSLGIPWKRNHAVSHDLPVIIYRLHYSRAQRAIFIPLTFLDGKWKYIWFWLKSLTETIMYVCICVCILTIACRWRELILTMYSLKIHAELFIPIPFGSIFFAKFFSFIVLYSFPLLFFFEKRKPQSNVCVLDIFHMLLHDNF